MDMTKKTFWFLNPGWWSTPHTGRFTHRERPDTHCVGECVDPQGRSGRVRKISPPPGFDLRTVQRVAGSYTDHGPPIPLPMRKVNKGLKHCDSSGVH
jgi:hypothetical protein